MPEISFKFDMEEKVKTPFGEGFVDMLGFDEGGIKYYVRYKESAGWFKEGQLTSAAKARGRRKKA